MHPTTTDASRPGEQISQAAQGTAPSKEPEQGARRRHPPRTHERTADTPKDATPEPAHPNHITLPAHLPTRRPPLPPSTLPASPHSRAALFARAILGIHVNRFLNSREIEK